MTTLVKRACLLTLAFAIGIGLATQSVRIGGAAGLGALIFSLCVAWGWEVDS
jgi:hypothetical protein